MNKDRCYIRGLTLLGLLNTIIGCVFNRVLCIVTTEDGKIIDYFFDKADRWPPSV
jgi:hypothetical protein